MSLTSYRAAPPRAKKKKRPVARQPGGLLAKLVCHRCAEHEAGRPGSDLLSRALRQSTIGAAGFHDRVRNGVGWDTCAITTWSSSFMNRGDRQNAGAAERHPKNLCAPLCVHKILYWVACKIAYARHSPLRTTDQAYRTISTN